jgi:hypothetical protein
MGNQTWPPITTTFNRGERMNRRKMLFAWLGGFAVMMVLGFLWHGVIMAGFYGKHMEAVLRENGLMLFVVLGYLVLAFLMSYLYPIGYKGGPPVNEGLRFGAFMGLVAFLPFNLIYYGMMDITLSGAIIDSIWHVVEEAAGGMIIALLYGSGATEPA